jgi:hypothetical protein
MDMLEEMILYVHTVMTGLLAWILKILYWQRGELIKIDHRIAKVEARTCGCESEQEENKL